MVYQNPGFFWRVRRLILDDLRAFWKLILDVS